MAAHNQQYDYQNSLPSLADIIIIDAENHKKHRDRMKEWMKPYLEMSLQDGIKQVFSSPAARNQTDHLKRDGKEAEEKQGGIDKVFMKSSGSTWWHQFWKDFEVWFASRTNVIGLIGIILTLPIFLGASHFQHPGVQMMAFCVLLTALFFVGDYYADRFSQFNPDNKDFGIQAFIAIIRAIILFGSLSGLALIHFSIMTGNFVLSRIDGGQKKKKIGEEFGYYSFRMARYRKLVKKLLKTDPEWFLIERERELIASPWRRCIRWV